MENVHPCWLAPSEKLCHLVSDIKTAVDNLSVYNTSQTDALSIGPNLNNPEVETY